MKPTNNFVRPLLTDLYQLTMAYGYWKSGHEKDNAVFDLFFRKNPFKGEFTIFAGLEEVIRFISNFKIEDEDIEYLKKGKIISKKELEEKFEEELKNNIIKEDKDGFKRKNIEGKWEKCEIPKEDVYIPPLMSNCEQKFFDWLKNLDCSELKIYSLKEGTITFPRIPLIRVEGPLALCQLVETTLLTLVNYPSLVATNAARFRLAAGKDKKLIEFGLRRAQGPDGGISASRYCYIGGFDATSNVLAGKLFGIPVKGTHAHSFVSCFSSLNDLKEPYLKDSAGNKINFVDLVLKIRKELNAENTNEGELAAFIAYAQSFPTGFLALIDTYDTLTSGVINFLCVAIALKKLGYNPIGIRLDSGDLAYLSKECRKKFIEIGKLYGFDFKNLVIVASNDINEPTLISLNQQEHEIDIFGIGTHLVTCQAQPALGAVYKLVEINGKPRIKLSQEKSKITLPGKKEAYRLIGKEGYPLVDLIKLVDEKEPQIGEKILCRHPFEAAKRVYVKPSKVIKLHHCIWDNGLKVSLPSIYEVKRYVQEQLDTFRPDHLRFLNPTPYKVSLTQKLYDFLNNIWLKEAPIEEIT